MTTRQKDDWRFCARHSVVIPKLIIRTIQIFDRFIGSIAISEIRGHET